MSTASRFKQNLFGLFELDPAGTILYSRIEPTGGDTANGLSATDVTGRNFFDEVVSFENVEEFRRRVADFTRSGGHANNFNFNCQFDSEFEAVRVLLARIRERAEGNHTKSILMHIRKA
jgi:hypothetical protein